MRRQYLTHHKHTAQQAQNGHGSDLDEGQSRAASLVTEPVKGQDVQRREYRAKHHQQVAFVQLLHVGTGHHEDPRKG
ncbi:hypothetical protein D3C77_531160 [compost metagenome]